jgi:hypothetical protein
MSVDRTTGCFRDLPKANRRSADAESRRFPERRRPQRRLALGGGGAQSRDVRHHGGRVHGREVRDGRLAYNWVERSAYELAERLKQPAAK